MSELSKVGRYVKTVDPDQYRRITSIIGSRKTTAVGAYVEMVDPEMFDQILAHN